MTDSQHAGIAGVAAGPVAAAPEVLPPVAEVVPHAGAMLLIDALLHAGEDDAVARATVRATQLFVDEAGMPAWVGVEYMAQTIAAWAGMRDRRAGRAPGIGFLLGTRRYECAQPSFAVGSELTIRVRSELAGDNGLGMFACTIEQDGRMLAQANLSVYQPDDAQAFLQAQAGTRPTTQPEATQAGKFQG
ncbi:ApeP family dehydratase [Cupriavidus sp. USMAHM13]|uniref:ApeP family dehydratase n=1 Tax=Cupriavidus sp. USMAHM13 TaxID=1389192 RepID=UPI0009F2B269|nr:hotdog family protein [Cupriavidus sp. USMAHM13]